MWSSRCPSLACQSVSNKVAAGMRSILCLFYSILSCFADDLFAEPFLPSDFSRRVSWHLPTSALQGVRLLLLSSAWWTQIMAPIWNVQFAEPSWDYFKGKAGWNNTTYQRYITMWYVEMRNSKPGSTHGGCQRRHPRSNRAHEITVGDSDNKRQDNKRTALAKCPGSCTTEDRTAMPISVRPPQQRPSEITKIRDLNKKAGIQRNLPGQGVLKSTNCTGWIWYNCFRWHVHGCQAMSSIFFLNTVSTLDSGSPVLTTSK